MVGPWLLHAAVVARVQGKFLISLFVITANQGARDLPNDTHLHLLVNFFSGKFTGMLVRFQGIMKGQWNSKYSKGTLSFHPPAVRTSCPSREAMAPTSACKGVARRYIEGSLEY